MSNRKLIIDVEFTNQAVWIVQSEASYKNLQILLGDTNKAVGCEFLRIETRMLKERADGNAAAPEAGRADSERPRVRVIVSFQNLPTNQTKAKANGSPRRYSPINCPW
jgi:hypothetical protein